jgi:putative aldouronate transport system substrate-binding protein
VAKAFTEQDPDGDGKNNTYGFALSGESGIAIDKMFGVSNTGFVDIDGELVYAWDRIAASNAFKQRLFKDGLVDPNYLADQNGEQAKQDWLSGKLGMYVMQHALQYNPGFNNYQTLKSNVPTAEIMPIPLPETEFGTFSYGFLNPVQMTTVIYRGAKDPVSAIKYIDFMSTKETALVLKFGLEGVHWKTGSNGCPEAIDPEKNKIELVYVPDLAMQTSPALLGDCNKTEASFNPDDPAQKEYLEFIRQAREIYQSPDRPIPDITHNEHMPTPPKELSQIQTDLSQELGNLWAKAIVGDGSYTVDKALADAQAAWNNAGGKDLEAWYADWYRENKDKAFLAKDIYTFLD